MVQKRFKSRVAAFWLLGAWIASSALAADSAAPRTVNRSAPAADEIRSWIAKLDDDRYLVREDATQRLFDAGAAALDALSAAADSDRPEPADRSIWILR